MFQSWAERGVWDAILPALVDLGLTDDWRYLSNRYLSQGSISAAAARGGLARRLLINQARILREKSRPPITIRDVMLSL